MIPSDSNHANRPLSVPVTPLPADSQHLPTSVLLSSLMQGDTGAPVGPPALHATPTLSGLLQALRRRWLLAGTLATVAAAATVALVVMAMPAKYVVEIRAFVAAKLENNVFERGSQDETEFVLVKAYHQALVKSPFVLMAALNEPVSNNKPASELSIVKSQGTGALEWLDRSLKADFKVAPEILSVWLSGDDPEEVAELLNAVGSAFVKENEEKERLRRDQRLQQLRANHLTKEQELAGYRKTRDDHLKNQDAKAQLSRQQELLNATQYSAILRGHLLASRGKVDDAIVELNDLEGRAKRVQEVPAPKEKIDEYLRGDPIALSYFTHLLEIDKNIQSIRQRHTAQFADRLVREEEGARKDVLQKLAQHRKDALPELEAIYRQKVREELTEKIASAKTRLAQFDTQKQAIQTEIAVLDKRIATLSAGQSEPADVAATNDKIRSAEKAIDHIHQTIILMGTESIRPRVSLLQPALPPTSRDYSRQIKVAGAGGIGVFGLVLFGVALFEFRSRRISVSDDVSQGLGLQVVGSLPNMPSKVRGYLTSSNGARQALWQSQLHESVDAIRTMLLHTSRTESLRVIMVTSANGGEGKTSLSSQLAASLARSWKRTLLIDGDLRHPAAHTLFEVAAEPGFSEVLRGEVAAGDAIRATQLSRLWVLPAGNFDSQALQAMAQDNVRTLFEELKQQYDFIIVDSCPVLPVADALLLGQHVDGVIFSILRDVSRAPEVFAAQRRLNPLGIRTLGAVMIGESADVGRRGYPYVAAAPQPVS